MRGADQPALLQRWVIVTDERGEEHLEARWVVEGEIRRPATHAA